MTPRPAVPPARRWTWCRCRTRHESSRVDPDRRWHLAGPSAGGGDSDSQFGPLGGDFAAGARSRVPFGERFVLYQRNIENLCRDKASLREEIRKSVAELLEAALESGAEIAIKGAPEQHAEGANGPGDE
jgi:hypothetical protein